MKAGEIGKALGLRTSVVLRRDLHGTAILGALELLRDSRYKEAGQVIAAFNLEEDFGPELKEIILDLIQEGKPGIARQLAQSLGSDYSAEFSDQVLESALNWLSRGELAKALGLVKNAGLQVVQDEFRLRFAEYVASAIDEGNHECVRKALEVPTAASFLTNHDLIRALDFSSARVSAVVTNVVIERGFLFARLTDSKIDIFVPRSVVKRFENVPEKGAKLLLSVANNNSKGPRATWTALSDPI